jgi:uncharacterized membrane protein
MSGIEEARKPQPDASPEPTEASEGAPAPAGAASEPLAPEPSPPVEAPAAAPGGSPDAAARETPTGDAPSAEGAPSSGPPAPSEPATASLDPETRDRLLVSGGRSLALFTLLGGALAAWSQIAFRAPWLDDFLLENTSEPGQRSRLLTFLALGFVLGAVGSVGWMAFRRRRSLDFELVERWGWFLSPLILLPFVPPLFRARVWTSRYDALLPAMVLLLLVFERLAERSLANVPESVKAWFREVAAQVPPIVKKHGALAIVVAAASVYAAFFVFYTLRWHYKLRTGNYDLSINNNLMYGGLHGHFLESPVVFPKDPPKYLANHAKFGAYLFLPIYAIVPRAETLLVIQSVFIGFGALPFFAFVRRHLPEWMALVLALAYLAYYPLHGASFSEFQALPVAAFFVFSAVWAADTKRYRILAVTIAIALLMREDVAIGIAVFGAFLLLTGYRPVPGLVIACVAASYFFFLRFYVMEQAGSWWFPNMYKDLWADGEKGFRSVVKTLATNPLFVLSKIIVEKKILYLLHLLVPLAFLPLRRWYLWAALAPGAFLTLLVTNYDPPVTFSFHYVMHWAPYLFLGAALALSAMRRAPDGIVKSHAAVATLVASTLVMSFNYGAFPRREGSFKAGFNRIEFTLSDAERARFAEFMELVKDVPPDAPLAATEKVGPHLSSRVNFFSMRQGPQTAEYIVGSSRELKLSKTRPTLKEALESGRYGVLRRIGDFALMKKGHSTEGNAQLMEDWAL